MRRKWVRLRRVTTRRRTASGTRRRSERRRRRSFLLFRIGGANAHTAREVTNDRPARPATPRHPAFDAHHVASALVAGALAPRVDRRAAPVQREGALMPTIVPPKVRKTYTRERSHLTDPPPMARLVVYIRADQATWLVEEEGRRLSQRKRRRGPAPGPVVSAESAELTSRKGRNGKLSEIVREGIDLVIEYARHAEFMAAKLGSGVRPAAAPRATAAAARQVVSEPPRWREGKATRGFQPEPPSASTSAPAPREPGPRSPGFAEPDPQSSGSSGQS